jgi:hypothetical protein
LIVQRRPFHLSASVLDFEELFTW